MQTAALHACLHFGVPLVPSWGHLGRSGGTETHVDDWTEYLHLIDRKLAAAIDRLEGGDRLWRGHDLTKLTSVLKPG
jgi:predicted 5'-methylthioadenosine/S-adenosylhomocysteine nucleosidase